MIVLLNDPLSAKLARRKPQLPLPTPGATWDQSGGEPRATTIRIKAKGSRPN